MCTNECNLSTECDASSKTNELKQIPGIREKTQQLTKKKKPTLSGQPMKISSIKYLKMPFPVQNYFFMLTAFWLNTNRTYFLATNRFEKHRYRSPVYSVCLKLKLTNSSVFKCVNVKNYIPQLYQGNVYKCETELQVNSLWIL